MSISIEQTFLEQFEEAMNGDHNDLRREAIVLRAFRAGAEAVRRAALEDAATIADGWSDKNKPQQPKKSRFDIYDIQRYARTATKLVAEDIRAEAERIGKNPQAQTEIEQSPQPATTTFNKEP